MRSLLPGRAPILGAVLLLSGFLGAQIAPASSHRVALAIDSGWVANDAPLAAADGLPAVVYQRVVTVPNAGWLRLEYDGVKLSGADDRGDDGSFLRITSLKDGHVQTQHTVHVRQWRNTSAYFNGDAVIVEILAHPGTGRNRIVIDGAIAGDPMPESICGTVDNRALSSDNRVGRNQPTGCTSWLINDCNHCLLTAGHCTFGLQVVEFNVPLSTTSGSIQHPPPSDQYSVDMSSLQGNGGQGIGDDWAYFGLFPNSNTGLTAWEAQGKVAFDVVSPPPVSGQNIRITGNGSVSSPVSPTWYLVQKTHAGPYFSFSGTTVRYRTDTSGGNSGSPVIDDSTGKAIGIHTHAGCTSTGGANHGTGSNHSGLQSALANPQGVCFCPGLSFQYSGLPQLLDPLGQVVRVQVAAAGSNTPAPGTGMLHYDIGRGFQSVPMTQVQTNVYDATFPALPCFTDVRYYFSAQSTAGQTFTDPANAPNQAHEAVVATSRTTIVQHDFNTAPSGWTVQNTSLSTGPWQRVTPAGNGGSRSDPPSDYDGSGMCWVTGNGFSEDVDGGPTELITATYDLSGTNDPTVRFAAWVGSNSSTRRLDVDISSNGGGSWTQIETIGHLNGMWSVRSHQVKSLITNLSQVAFRFSIHDNPNQYVVEGGLDAFEIFDLDCGVPKYSTFGSGCPGSAGVPTLSAQNLPGLNTTFQLDMTNLPAGGGLAYMALGFSNTTWNGTALPTSLGQFGLPNCTGYISVDRGELIMNVGGTATWNLSIPNDPALQGMRFFNQGVSFDPGASGGMAVSDAGDGTVY